MRSHLFTLIAFGFVGGGCPATVGAGPIIIYESAGLGSFGSRGGATISLNQFVGISFSIADAVHVTAIGGDMGTSPGGTIFGAIVPVPTAGAVPSVAPLEIESIALGNTVFSAAAGHPVTTDFRTPIAMDLATGDYALIFGSGLFGASGQGFVRNNNIPFSSSVAFTTDNAPPPPGFPAGRWNSGFFGTGWRLVVEGELRPIPEPSTLLLLGSALVALVSVARQRRREREKGSGSSSWRGSESLHDISGLARCA